MAKNGSAITILMADDDQDDCMLTKDALEEARLANDLQFVQDGEELMDYLHRRGKYVDPTTSPHPGLILLDLNMPKKDAELAHHFAQAEPVIGPDKLVRCSLLAGDQALAAYAYEGAITHFERGLVARDISTELGMRPLMGKVAAFQATLSDRPAPTVKYPSNLTERQWEVLQLLGQGYTNREIAQALVLSERTVQRHIADIYGKICARNRSEATACAMSQLHPAK